MVNDKIVEPATVSELEAMAQIVRLLDGQTIDAQLRMLTWLAARQDDKIKHDAGTARAMLNEMWATYKEKHPEAEIATTKAVDLIA